MKSLPNFQIQNEDPLFGLIRSMSKAEKRNFKLYATRNQGSGADAKFVKMFDAMDKMASYDESVLLKKAPELKPSQLSNMKRHLYGQVLTSLRLLYSKRLKDIEIREEIDFARILYSKGLYLQALKVLERARTMAHEAHQDILELEILEFEKLIESRHITRSLPERALELTDRVGHRSQVIDRVGRMSNIALKLYGFYVQIGHVRHEEDRQRIQNIVESMPKVSFETMTFFEKIQFCQVWLWYHYLLQDFVRSYRYAKTQVGLYTKYPSMQLVDADMYLRSINQLMTAQMHIGHLSGLSASIDLMEQFTQAIDKDYHFQTELQLFDYLLTAKIHRHFIEGKFIEGTQMVKSMEPTLLQYVNNMDLFHVLLYYYKFACMYFGAGDYSTAIDYLNAIINTRTGALREDIQCYARILHLICHYELGHYNLLEYLVKSVYRFLIKMEDMNPVIQRILQFLRKELYSNPHTLKDAFILLRTDLEDLRKQPTAQRSFVYLDILAWLDSKILQLPVSQVIAERNELYDRLR